MNQLVASDELANDVTGAEALLEVSEDKTLLNHISALNRLCDTKN